MPVFAPNNASPHVDATDLAKCLFYALHRHTDSVPHAYAGAALQSRLQLSSQQVAQTRASLPCSIAEAAAALHGAASRLPLPAKLASCRLLAHLMSSQNMVDTVLPAASSGGLHCLSFMRLCAVRTAVAVLFC